MRSYWIESTDSEKGKFENLKEDIQVDVCIIGGGMAGISTAYELSKKGLKVAVLEKDEIALHTTGNTTAKITSGHGLIYKYLKESFSLDYARKYFNANQEAIQKIKENVENENIECDFEIQDNYVYTLKRDEVLDIQEEVSIVNSIGGNAQFVTKSNLPFKIQGGIKLSNQAQFHPRKYILGLCDCIIQNGGDIYTNTKVCDIDRKKDLYNIKTKDNTVISKYLVMATHYPILDIPGMYFLKMYQEKSYIIGVDIKQNVFDGMYINNSEPIYSFRSCDIDRKKMLLVGGSGHKVGQNENVDNSYAALEEYIKSIYLDCEIKYRWSTQDCVTLDKIPYIGEFSSIMPNMFVATGFNKWGMTFTHVASNIITDKILGKDNKYEDVFKATRLKPIKNREEMKNMIKQTTKSLVLDKFVAPEELENSLEEGQGKIVKIGDNKVGISKIEGKIYAIKPVCSHLGCQLSFNSLDKTWDCPCHGSKFDHMGYSLEAPSVKTLEKS